MLQQMYMISVVFGRVALEFDVIGVLMRNL